jgi:hypothetical protein
MSLAGQGFTREVSCSTRTGLSSALALRLPYICSPHVYVVAGDSGSMTEMLRLLLLASAAFFLVGGSPAPAPGPAAYDTVVAAAAATVTHPLHAHLWPVCAP